MESLSISTEVGLTDLPVSQARAPQARVHMIRRAGQGDLILESIGRGHPVLLLHGWGVDRRMWAHQVPVLRRYFRVISMDRRGFGQSTCAPGLEQELDDIDAVLEHFKIPQVALVGMSQGGRVAIRYASSRPALVSALVLQGAPLDGMDPPSGDTSILPVARLSELLRTGDRNSALRLLGEHPLIDCGAHAAAKTEILAMLRDYRGEDLRIASGAAQTRDSLRDQLSRITAPTMVLTGSRETLWLRAVADYTARNIRGARRRVIRGGRHFVNMTHAPDYNHCLADFLQRATRPWSERALGIS